MRVRGAERRSPEDVTFNLRPENSGSGLYWGGFDKSGDIFGCHNREGAD